MFIKSILVYSLAVHAGFSKNEANVVTCIAKHESSFNVKAINDKLNANGSADIGLMQINKELWADKCEGLNLYNAYDNLVCAKLVYDRQGFSAWVAYNKYQKKCDNFKISP